MLKNILKDVGDKHGVTLLSDDDSPCVVSEWLSTGCNAFDVILGGGLPVGRLTEMYGDTSTGKSLIGAQVAALAIEQGYIVAYVDTESAVSLSIMEAVGVDINKLLYLSPETIEEVFEFFEDVITSKNKHDPDNLLLLIWDSVAATSVKQEQEAEYGKATMGRHAQIISASMRKIIRKISKARVCALFLNQTRQKIGVMYGDNETTFGGNAIPFYSSVRVRLKKGSKIKSKDAVVGIETRAIVVKHKIASPFKEATLPIYFGFGVDDAEATFHYLNDNKFLVGGTGGWYTLGDLRFRKKTFAEVYDENYDYILDMMYGDA